MNRELKNKIAIALKYTKEYQSPQVVAKGKGAIAEKIVEKARESGVEVYQDQDTAESLFRLELGEEIPEALYMTVATILSHVYALNEEKKHEKR